MPLNWLIFALRPALRLPKIIRFCIFEPRAALAQLVEHLICNQAVSGSSPLGGSKFALTRVRKKTTGYDLSS